MNNNVQLQKEFDYYKDNIAELAKNYLGKYIVIKNQCILGSYDNFDEAIRETLKTEELGTFLVQRCEDNKDSYTQTYHSRVKFLN